MEERATQEAVAEGKNNALFSANTLHIMSWNEVQSFLMVWLLT